MGDLVWPRLPVELAKGVEGGADVGLGGRVGDVEGLVVG